MITNPHQPVALTIAGSDSSGGAGIQADLKTFSALGVHGASAITAVTAQNVSGVSAIEVLTPRLIAKQIEAVALGADVSAIKTGMLGDCDTIETVATSVKKLPSHVLIVDPVMVATSGARLLGTDSIDVLKQALLPIATLITPNLDEAAVLLGTDAARNKTEMEHQARALEQAYQLAVLLKGGHRGDDDKPPSNACDVLASKGTLKWFEAPWIVGADTHGTGCTLSAAITAQCAKGNALEDSISIAKTFVTTALQASCR